MSIKAERDGAVATLWLDRPERGNALGAGIVDALSLAFDAAMEAGVRLIVLRGSGKHFCTGLDLGDLDAISDGDLALRILRIELLLQKVHGAPVTTMAIGNGRIFGAGADLFAACDHRVALEEARFSFPGPAFGLVLGTARLAALVGDSKTRALLLSGEPVDAPAALALGLATAIGSPDEAVAAAARDAERLEPATVAMLHGRTRRADDDGDLAALARSLARPGLVQRVKDYRARMLAAR
ncbi:enoyl-CoA hydratase/isomerase family protein [Roseococcus sp. SYP-B2431]|uniref:enoyl-CoA hydratase/isomerase family protein n=1 Tax=Roseococcus sp. SYP-B2431 TaxID=2496640 RepID=UPI00103B4338|nr:enoyl-CoA hydratase/isomerase family protein [Roseococcus sp. SYP-B2431]TCH96202.1 enoyl-CoA hydratase/isomerase family protein [Roseococcus sp. SYP-B2431]